MPEDGASAAALDTADQASIDPVGTARALGPMIRSAADEIERTRRIPGPNGGGCNGRTWPHKC